MKTLLKISCLFAIVLFSVMSVKAADPLKVDGTITVTVPEHLAMVIATPNVGFIYDEFGSTSNLNATTSVVISANVDWKLSVAATSSSFTDGLKSFGLDKVTLGGVVTGTLSTTPLTSAVFYGNQTKSIDWTLAALTQQYAGTYTAGITYTLAKN